MQTKMKCSTCQSNLFSCSNFKPLVPIGLLSCKNCFINGNLKEHVKLEYKLHEKAVWNELNETYNKLRDDFEKYQRKFDHNQNKVFDVLKTIINDQTFAFTKDFVKYHEQIKSYDSRFQKIIANQINTIKSATEVQVKKILIEEVKKMNSLLANEQKINKENVSQVAECGDFVRKMISPLTIKALRRREVVLKTFSTDKINECVRIFGGLTGEMNLKAEGFRRLEETGKEMLGEERNVDPAEAVYTEVQFQQRSQKMQNSILNS